MIVIPMAGLSSRFYKAGYTQPKYMLQAHGRSLFRHAVESFAPLFGRVPFLFIARDLHDTAAFIRSECAAAGLSDARTIMLDRETAGQADTVRLGLEAAQVGGAVPVTIFNIDTFRHRFKYPAAFDVQAVDGWLEVFRGDGANWSYVRPEKGDATQRVFETAEKRPISDLCCTGLYHFARSGDFLAAIAEAAAQPRSTLQGGELYVAPLYNSLIARGADIRYDLIPREDVTFCGTPAEYDAFLAGPAC